MLNILKKNWLLIFIIVLLFIGSVFAVNDEGMSLERLCYVRESDGAKICMKGDSSCTYFSDGTSKCTQGKNVCSQFTSCAECTDKNAKPLGGTCYWNNSENKCGSTLETGYSPFCKNPNTNTNTNQMNNSYIPVISLLPTNSFSNAAPSNYYSM